MKASFLTELGEQLEQFRHSAGWRLYEQLRAVDATFNVLAGNSRELMSVIDDFSGRARSQDELLLTKDGREQLDRMIEEAQRRLFNFLGATGALVDHYRVFKTSEFLQANSAFVKEYERRTNSLGDNDWQLFVKGLRNYSHHRGVPEVSAILSRSIDKPPGARFVLHVDRLENWDGWNQRLATFLISLNEEVSLEEIANKYLSLSREFYAWFRQEQVWIQADLLSQAAEGFSRFYNEPLNRFWMKPIP